MTILIRTGQTLAQTLRPSVRRIGHVNGAVGELIFHNRYSYAGANPVNLVDPSGLCSRVVSSGPGQKTENFYDAIECRSLRDELRTWSVNVVWDELRAIDPYSPENCGQPAAVQAAVEQAHKGFANDLHLTR